MLKLPLLSLKIAVVLLVLSNYKKIRSGECCLLFKITDWWSIWRNAQEVGSIDQLDPPLLSWIGPVESGWEIKSNNPTSPTAGMFMVWWWVGPVSCLANLNGLAEWYQLAQRNKWRKSACLPKFWNGSTQVEPGGPDHVIPESCFERGGWWRL